MSAAKPTIYLIAGCNGAGKTTFAKEFLPHEVKCLRFYNADELARGLSPSIRQLLPSKLAGSSCAKSANQFTVEKPSLSKAR